MKLFVRTLLLFAALGLAGCAASYTPYAADTAAKVRLRLGNGALFSALTTNLRPIVDGKCGEVVSLPQLRQYVLPPTGNQSLRPSPSETGTTYPRAGMQGSTDPLRSDTAELQLAPGRYVFSLIGSLGPSMCGAATVIDVDPNRQYEIEFRVDGVARKCYASTSRLDKQDDAAQWRAYATVSAEACSK
jgi:hypothetical protein